MLTFRLSELQGQRQGADVAFSGLCSDSREISPGVLFVALPGERVDGHQFVAQARLAGAAAALVSHPVDDPLPQLIVADTVAALGEIAKKWRQKHTLTVIALTGSNGKTTVKNLLAAILGRIGPTLATDGNRNNEIGVPLTLARLNASHRFAVIEMGAGKPGDIAYLTEIAQPSVALVNNASSAHIERLGSVTGVAATKGAIYDTVALEHAVINRDDPFASAWAERAAGARVGYFALDRPQPGDVSAIALALGPPTRFILRCALGEAPIELKLEGRHNVRNALAAAACAIAAGAPLDAVVDGLRSSPAQSGRLNRLVSARGYALIDDAYNANPASLKAAIDTLSGAGTPKLWLALGDMGELGSEAPGLHAECGRYAQLAGVEKLFAIGELGRHTVAAFGAGARHFESANALAEALDREIGAGVTLLVKGSRSARMERVIDALKLKEGEPC